ncbi:hypothetical protein SAMD00019534_087770 [Acytostelium subglobosum LB1]|uniref:hypothetical protein n=1 Tax=Acytostelium subglobosum LB1 TaxID=1410327 RepID=UPI0006448872|nr:hypothetical protein SAMD00019534_087770 [Acytostelium subglobosum LB1]GAM25602.1 hypothetical protein SAMD00019534_087770 [Acytostelium subglobosum LB1]|eukprot:XP_012751588.1 hypothetical protein SAMD00019534_087770 [Acytostelium subglobosum LB1]
MDNVAAAAMDTVMWTDANTSANDNNNIVDSQSSIDKMFSNNPYNKKNLQFPFKLPSILDIIKDGMHTVKHIEWKEDQTPLFWSLSHVLSQLPIIGDEIVKRNGYANPTHASLFVSPTGEIPRITIPDYLVRLVKFSPCSKECFIMIIVYINRLITQSNFIVTSFNIHRLLITAILVASKYIDDIFYNNEYYSHIGGVTRDELNKLEIDFLTLLEFDVSCPWYEYLEYFSLLDNFVAHIRQLRHKNAIQAPIAIQASPVPVPSHISFSASSSPTASMSPVPSTTTFPSNMPIKTNSNNTTKVMTNNNYIIVNNTGNNNHISTSSSSQSSQVVQQMCNNSSTNNSSNVTQPVNVPTATANITTTRRKSIIRDQAFFPMPTCIS